MSQNAETLTEAEIAALPLDERMYFALLDAGLDESDAQEAINAVLPLFAVDLRELAGQVEWQHRRMTFTRDCGSETRLHPAGQTIREHARSLGGFADRLAEAWERGHFYCAAEVGGYRCRNPYRATETSNGTSQEAK